MAGFHGKHIVIVLLIYFHLHCIHNANDANSLHPALEVHLTQIRKITADFIY